MAEGTYGSSRGVGERLGELVVRLLRVPPPPTVPAGAPGSLRNLRPAPGFYRYLLLRWGAKQVGTLVGLVLGLVFISRAPFVPFPELVQAAELLGVAGFVLQIPLTLYVVRLEYEYRWYLITDRSLRIREGVLTVREQTLSFANVQNLSVHQGPLQRAFGISDLRVRTAGGGGRGEGDGSGGTQRDLHLGHLRGLAAPETIRDLIVSHVRSLRGAGLGDPDDAPDAGRPGRATGGPGGRAGPAASLDAARELLAEARRLRAAVPGRRRVSGG